MGLDTEVGTYRSFVTHTSLCNTLSSYKCPKTVKILAIKGSKRGSRGAARAAKSLTAMECIVITKMPY